MIGLVALVLAGLGIIESHIAHAGPTAWLQILFPRADRTNGSLWTSTFQLERAFTVFLLATFLWNATMLWVMKRLQWLDRSGRSPYSIGGQFENGVFKAKIREFGNYSVMADTIAPVIKALNISDGKNISRQQTIRINISDGLSGIKSYKAYLNDKWILMDYDAKNNLLVYERDERLTTGTNKFLLVVEDYCGNSSRYEAKLIN